MRVLTITLTTFLMVILWSCEKEESEPCCSDPENPSCANYDPCYRFYPANADFKIQESLFDQTGFIDTVIETDTLLWNNLALFEPVEQYYDSLKWIVGAETLTTHTVTRTNFPIERNVDITLIVFKPSASTCFPGVASADTVTKTFYSAKESLIFGHHFIGNHIKAKAKDQIVSFQPSVNGYPFGLPHFCRSREFPGPLAIGYKHVISASRAIVSNYNSCYRLNCVAEAYAGDSIRILYHYRDTSSMYPSPIAETKPIVVDVFKGKRLE